ncbi:MAG: class I SAM-dependent methyltransferase [Chloroflexi bacterium]|nr:class I SAM-dependent methyltransferase [Chloroflexota bacterium]
MESKLLDMRNCSDGRFQEIHRGMLRIHLAQQPRWFRPLLLRSSRLQHLIDYDHWSRAWEYPWAVQAAALDQNGLNILDVGGGGSPFAAYLAEKGHSCHVIDPSMNRGLGLGRRRDKGLYWDLRSLVFRPVLRCIGITSSWGLPWRRSRSTVRYYAYSATDIKFADRSFDRVFCLSVMEHIPRHLWRRCMEEFERVLKPGGRLILTLDMGTVGANDREYLSLVDSCSLKLLGDLPYETPISPEDKELRHPGYSHETLGLVWQG